MGRIVEYSPNPYMHLVKIGNKWGYINKNGKIVIPLKYDYADDFRDNLAWVRLGNKRGYINKKGKLKISAKFDEMYDFCNGIAKVRLGNKYGCK